MHKLWRLSGCNAATAFRTSQMYPFWSYTVQWIQWQSESCSASQVGLDVRVVVQYCSVAPGPLNYAGRSSGDAERKSCVQLLHYYMGLSEVGVLAARHLRISLENVLSKFTGIFYILPMTKSCIFWGVQNGVSKKLEGTCTLQLV